MFRKLILFHDGTSTKSIAKLKQKFYEISWTGNVRETFSEIRKVAAELIGRECSRIGREHCIKSAFKILPVEFEAGLRLTMS